MCKIAVVEVILEVSRQNHRFSLEFLLQFVDQSHLPLQTLYLPGTQSKGEYWDESDN